MKRILKIVSCFLIIIVLIYGVFSLILFDTSAKYTDYKELNHYFESKELYISSKSLSDQDNKYNIINYYDFNDIQLEINNNISDNQITNYNINYNLECNILDNQNNLYECQIDNKNNKISSTLISNKECLENSTLSEEECILQNYNYDLAKSTNSHTFKIINHNGTEKTIKVELILTTTAPYSKTLKATYVLNIGDTKNNNININEVEEYNSFCEYIITNNYHSDKTIRLSINTNKLIFDTTSDIYNNKINYTIDNQNIINTITFILSNNTSIKLYKKDFKSSCNINDINYLIIE